MSGDTYVLHRALRRMAAWAVWSFFTEVHVIGGEHVPKKGPIIVAKACCRAYDNFLDVTAMIDGSSNGRTATHHNMMLDPAVLSAAFPHHRIMHYWSKASLFGNPAMKWILLSSGNIPVDRKSKDRQILFRGTFDALSKGEAVALFPEGTSYTEPRIMQVKDGAAWAAMEYTKWARDNPEKASPLPITICPSAIVYTDKSKYRSSAIMEFGEPITMEPYLEEFYSAVEGAQRSAVKRLTRKIESELIGATINAPDWDTLYSARMARDLLWEGHNVINLDDYVTISQTLVDLFSTTDATPNFKSVKHNLLEYYSLLQTTQLSNSVLSALPLPRTLDPNTPTPLPGRLRTLVLLVGDSAASLTRLPFFLFPLIVHAPIYIMGRLGARLVEHEEESQAQNKVVIGLLLLMMIYPLSFWLLWALFMYTRTGAVMAAATVWLFAIYHNKLINDNYEHAKRLVTAWRLLVGVWVPKRWDLTASALSQYTTPVTPAANPWVDRAQEVVAGPPPSEEPPVKSARKRRPPTRRIIRHVLRARAEAAKSLATFFQHLERQGQGKKVRASVHLARVYGWVDEAPKTMQATGVEFPVEPVGWRRATEVLAFLKQKGAKVASLSQGVEAEWAALSSDGEQSPYDPRENTSENAFFQQT